MCHVGNEKGEKKNKMENVKVAKYAQRIHLQSNIHRLYHQEVKAAEN